MDRSLSDLIEIAIYRTILSPNFTRRIEWRKMLRWLRPARGEKVLDIACGTGWLTFKIAEAGCEAHGIDMSPEALRAAKRISTRTGIACQFVLGNAQQLPYADGYFDKVLCSSSLEHMADDASALREMHRVLKPGGSLVLTVDSLSYPMRQEVKEMHRRSCYVVNYYSREELVEKLRLCSIEVRRAQYLLNSRLTHAFMDLWIRHHRSTALWLAIAVTLHPAFLLSDRLFGSQRCGDTVIAEAQKGK